MNKFLYYPVKNPINATNPFGTPSSVYTNLGQVGHPGEDYQAPSGTPLYAPCDGDAFYAFDKNGGDGIYIRYPNNINPTHNIILWHMWPRGNAQYPFKIATDGSITSVKAGQLLGYTDNSGYPIESNGSHLHVGVMPCDRFGGPMDPLNGFRGCVSPSSFWNGKFAEDIATEQQIIEKAAEVVKIIADAPLSNQEKISFWQKVAQLIKKLLSS